MDACSIAGIECLRLISEPTAAAVAYEFQLAEESQNALIFDFGGGTFDVTITTSSEDLIDVQSTSGDMMLGGRDLDEELIEIILDRLETERGLDLDNDLKA
mmetsp:Transcript_37960/g.46300  ORF Transcript_37960/g.46300 Transcript_37960/m.46300 type:complete len:101 (+) Transcript_37960:567-869(+)|eukprot:CAMPEP_0170453958 /NCGR_PEP_ID=MMETSP0123-20130129/2374_1 /TAXON_ID=182087 /ORGANISM="Favella ehrenbergii, Strain Fehren 1" /LENGTH=100 /DNA_ID=CAMNT_0010716519 /DNA_START=567 /DNA_END=869 /DNA_ORIENTATION=+